MHKPPNHRRTTHPCWKPTAKAKCLADPGQSRDAVLTAQLLVENEGPDAVQQNAGEERLENQPGEPHKMRQGTGHFVTWLATLRLLQPHTAEAPEPAEKLPESPWDGGCMTNHGRTCERKELRRNNL